MRLCCVIFCYNLIDTINRFYSTATCFFFVPFLSENSQLFWSGKRKKWWQTHLLVHNKILLFALYFGRKTGLPRFFFKIKVILSIYFLQNWLFLIIWKSEVMSQSFVLKLNLYTKPALLCCRLILYAICSVGSPVF